MANRDGSGKSIASIRLLCRKHRIYSLQPISALEHPKFQETHALCLALAPQTSEINLRTVSASLLMHFRIELPDSENEHPNILSWFNNLSIGRLLSQWEAVITSIHLLRVVTIVFILLSSLLALLNLLAGVN
jgi:hypothetical protein